MINIFFFFFGRQIKPIPLKTSIHEVYKGGQKKQTHRQKNIESKHSHGIGTTRA